jgi:hypothetical protein
MFFAVSPAMRVRGTAAETKRKSAHIRGESFVLPAT